MQQKKYGIVYIWFDKKRKMYYIGSHWGTDNDGYICSSNRMRDAYRRRPHDFKRRIIEKTNDRDMLLTLEQNWLNLAENNPSRHYNMCFTTKNPWWNDEYSRKTLSEKISIKTKEAMQRPDIRANYEKGLETRDNKSSDPETVEKRRQSMIAAMAEKFPVENRYKPMTDAERFEYYSNKAKDMHHSRTDEQREKIGKKISDALKGKQNRLGHTNSVEHREKISSAQFNKPGVGVMIEGTYYDSIAKASRETNIPIATMHRRLKSHKYTEYYKLG